MIQIQSFTFNPFQENTFVVYDQTRECLIIDPGCSDASERDELTDFIGSHQLKPVLLVNTHAHIDHIMGNAYIAGKYGIPIALNDLDLPLLLHAREHGLAFGVHVESSPEPTVKLEEGKPVRFGESSLDVWHTPGHSPGSVCLVDTNGKNVIGGDVLFRGSIGRTDLPGGDLETLLTSITDKLLPLGNDFTVYSGHGPATSIGEEKTHNPFLQPTFLNR
ncbi:MAG: MBL fold metallo-hydrolase [Flavobacteriales bacterium]|nr:MBL fold metallo-hydrolase [Flavobacteriales bacterium]MCB9449137.1 MBL fold metallo-hydrolase [Flavobacteriales bacterium]